jgi:hypothetical protein
VGLPLIGGNDILGGAGSWNGTLLGVLTRWVVISLPANSTLSIAMNGDFSSNFNLITTTWTSGLVGAVVVFNGVYSTSPTFGVDVHQPGAVGKVHTSYARLVSGSNLQHWFDGEQVGLSGATAATSLGSASNLAINRRVSADSLPYGSMGFVEIRATTAALTDAQIRAACLAPVGTPLPSGEVNAIVAADYNGTTIPPRVGGGTYTVTGGPTLTTYPIAAKSIGTVERIGNSRTGGRNAAGFLGEGYARECARLVNVSRHMTWNGQFPYTDAATVLDYSPYHTAVGGKGVCFTPAAAAAWLDSVAADRVLTIGADGVTLVDDFINDIYRLVRSTELNQAPATAVTNLTSATASYISGLRVSRTGPIIIGTTPRQSDGVTEVNQRTATDSWNAALRSSLIASWNSTYGSVLLWDAEAAMIARYGASYFNDVAYSFDGTHYTPDAYLGLAQSLAGRLLTVR